MKHCKITEQAYQKIPNIVTEQIVIETKTSARMIPVTADKDSIDEINRALEIAKKEHDLLEMYRTLEEWVEEYNTSDSTLRKQGVLAEIRVMRHLIAELESEMK